mgnify:FL=1
MFQILIIQACQAERLPAAASLSPSTSSAPLVSTSRTPSQTASSEPRTSLGPEPVGQSTSPETDAGAWKPEDHKSVILDRPHTLLLMSTVTGGVAIRGAFTGAMVRQFAKADGKTTINDMVTNAIVDMKKNEMEGYDQTPEARNTLQKSLILPPSGLYQTHQQGQNSQSKRELIEKIIGKSSQQP